MGAGARRYGDLEKGGAGADTGTDKMFRMAPAPAAKALWPVVLAATAVAVSGLVGLVVLDGVPHVSDEVAYFFQARIIASGQVCLPSPEQPQLFRQQNVILDGARWCALLPIRLVPRAVGRTARGGGARRGW